MFKATHNFPVLCFPDMRMRRCLSIDALFCLIVAPSLSFALQFTLQPWETDRPVPNTVMFFNATLSAGDPKLVDIILTNTMRKNSMTLFQNHNLVQFPNAGFKIPVGIPPGTAYMVQMADSSTTPRRTLAQSSAFQIYPAGMPPSVTGSPTTTAIVLDETALPMASAQPASRVSAPLPIGAIAGGVVGGIFLLILFVVLLYCIRKQGKPLTPEELEKKKKLKEKDIISPFIITQPSPDGPIDPTAGGLENSTTPQVPSAARLESRNEKARLARTINHMSSPRNYFTPNTIDRLPTELTANSTIGEGSSIGVHSPHRHHHHRRMLSASTNDTVNSTGPSGGGRPRRKRTREPQDAMAIDALRRERSRLDREITDLERRTSMGGSRGLRRPNTDNDEMLAQLAALREQMRLVETQVPNEPPPDYYPSSVNTRP